MVNKTNITIKQSVLCSKHLPLAFWSYHQLKEPPQCLSFSLLHPAKLSDMAQQCAWSSLQRVTRTSNGSTWCSCALDQTDPSSGTEGWCQSEPRMTTRSLPSPLPPSDAALPCCPLWCLSLAEKPLHHQITQRDYRHWFQTRHKASTEHSVTFRVRTVFSYREVDEASLFVGWL